MTRDQLTALQTAGIITDKERQVLELHRLSDRTIAIALEISRGSVRDRRKNALAKIARHERSNAA